MEYIPCGFVVNIVVYTMQGRVVDDANFFKN